MAIAVVTCALTLRASDESNNDVPTNASESALPQAAVVERVTRPDATVLPSSETALPEATPAVPRRLPSTVGFSPDIPLQPSYPKSPTAISAQPSVSVPPAAAGVLAYYQSPQATAILGQVPTRPAAIRQPQRLVYAPGKPFGNIQREPTVSPYLNLFRDENDDDQVPNYFTLVRPQLEQQQENRSQVRELQKLKQMVRTLEYQQQLNSNSNSGVPSTGHRTRFFDTTGYYASPARNR